MTKWVILAGMGIAAASFAAAADFPARAPAGVRAEDYFTAEEIARGKAYSASKMKFMAAGLALELAFWGVLLFSGMAAALERKLLALSGGRVWIAAPLFILAVIVVQHVVDYPLSYLREFRNEHAWGFSNLTFGAWNAEQLKALVVFLVIAVPGLMALYAVMRISPDRWWLWMSGVFGGIMILIMWAWPIVIAPIFNTFTPLPDGELKARVLAMTEKGGVRVDKVLVVDASRQSKHTNAYFAGVGSSKRVVLFDTLVKDHTPEEVENVLAHEIGHWRKNHIWKGLVIALAGFVLFFFLADKLLGAGAARGWGGMAAKSALAGLPLIYLLATVVGFASQPFQNAVSRHFEREADREEIALTGRPEVLVSSMQRMARTNLSDVDPHPFKEWYFYSHPSVMNRIRMAVDYRK
ncbi:MAG: M48 family metallopeptidase [Planctomycetota bacterium]